VEAVEAEVAEPEQEWASWKNEGAKGWKDYTRTQPQEPSRPWASTGQNPYSTPTSAEEGFPPVNRANLVYTEDQQAAVDAMNKRERERAAAQAQAEEQARALSQE
jgi:hypothetical protein